MKFEMQRNSLENYLSNWAFINGSLVSWVKKLQKKLGVLVTGFLIGQATEY